MFSELTQQLAAQEYWFSKVGDNETLLINVQDPTEAPAKEEYRPELGVIMSIQVRPQRLLARWTDNSAGYDETWEFLSVSDFTTFLNRFLEEGIDGV